MDWYQYYCWVYSASSLAINTSGWQLLLVSMIPTHLQARRCNVICHIFVSLTTDINRVSQNPLVPAAPQKSGNIYDHGVRVDYFFCFWLSVNSISSPDNGYSGARERTAYVGVHLYLILRPVNLQANFCIL